MSREEPNDGGPAFQETRPGGHGTTAGLTKREYFAIRFAALSNPSLPVGDMTGAKVAEFAVDFADALLKRLEEA